MMPQTGPIELTIPALFEGYAQRLYRYAFSLMHNAAEADEVVQETFLRAHHRLDSLRDPAALTPWLYRITTHICLDRLRQRTRRAPLEIDADPTDVTGVDSDSPSLQQIVEQNEMSDCVQRYPDSCRTAIGP